MPTLYDELGLTLTATDEDIRSAYRMLARQYHPDRNPGSEKLAKERFQRIQHAFEALTNPTKRATYDKSLGKDRFTAGPSSLVTDPPEINIDNPQSSRQTNWIPPVPKRDSGILGRMRVSRVRWRLWHLMGVLLVAGPTILYLKIIWSNWKPFPRDNVPDVDYSGPQFFVAFFGGLCLAILIAVITSQLRPDIAGSLAAVSLCLAVPSLLWFGYQVVHEIAVSEFQQPPNLPRHLLDISFNAAASILGVALSAGTTIGLVVSLRRHDEI